MRSREELLQTIELMEETKLLSKNDIIELLDLPPGTVKGWLADKSAFPVFSEGSRSQQNYTKKTFIKVVSYMYCVRNDGPKLNGSTAKNNILNLDSKIAIEKLNVSGSELVTYISNL